MRSFSLPPAGGVAQSVEQRTFNPLVQGSSPCASTFTHFNIGVQWGWNYGFSVRRSALNGVK